MLIDAGAAREKIKAIEPVLINAHEVGAERWFELVTEQPHLARSLSTTTRAGFLHDHICPEVETGVADFDGIYPTEALGFFGVRIDSEILLRLKYVGQGMPSNVATTQQKLLARQKYDDGMREALGLDPAMAPPTLLTCGYTLGDGEISHIEIRCDCKGKQPWSFEIYGGEAAAEPLQFTGTQDMSLPAAVTSSRDKAAEKGPGLAEEA
jgi:hypothetical protein